MRPFRLDLLLRMRYNIRRDVRCGSMTLKEIMKVRKLERDIRIMQKENERIFSEAERSAGKGPQKESRLPAALRKLFRRR